MATDRMVIDASALASINYNTYFADFFAGLGAAARKYYGGSGTSGSQVGFSYGPDVSDPYVLMTGTNVGYDMGSHTYAGSIDSINFGSVGSATNTTGPLVTGVEPGLLISNLGVSVAPGGGMGVDPNAADFNEVYAFLSAIRDAGLPAKHEAYVELLYKLLSSRAQDFTGTAGNDAYAGTAFDDLVQGGAGDDALNGGAGNDEINGGDGNDVLNGGDGNDMINGGAGDDTIRASSGADTIDGGDGNDTIIFAGSVKDFTVGVAAGGGITVSNGTWSTTLTNVETIKFEAPKFAPTNLALSKASVDENVGVNAVVGLLSASDQNDDPLTFELTNNAGGMFAIEKVGEETRLVVKKALNYEAKMIYDVTVKVSDVDQSATKTFTINVNDVNEGPSAPVTSNLKSAVAENVKAGTVVATLSATDPEKHALTYSLASGSSSAFKIDGNKVVVAKTLDYETLQGHSLKLVAKDAFGLTSSTTTVKIGVTDVLETIKGTNGANKLNGGIGADRIDGYNGNDVISAGAGNDKIRGGIGADKLTGGAGADTFVFKAKAESIATARDTIYDFSSKQGDRIDLSGLDANDAKTGIQDFAFIGTKAFSGKAGELRFEAKASDSYVYADTNGDKKADFVLHFDDKISFVKGDFLF